MVGGWFYLDSTKIFGQKSKTRCLTTKFLLQDPTFEPPSDRPTSPTRVLLLYVPEKIGAEEHPVRDTSET